MMTVGANKQLVRDGCDGVNRGEEAAVLAMTAEDFRFETMARAPDWMLYKWDRHQFAAARAAMSSVMKAPIQLSIAGRIGEGDDVAVVADTDSERSEEHTSELQSLMRMSYAVFSLQNILPELLHFIILLFRLTSIQHIIFT